MQPKFLLSAEESKLVENEELFYAKHRIIEKVYTLMGTLSESYSRLLMQHASLFPGEVTAVSPKIYRGENYLRLPYVMLDHPRFFRQEEACAIRSFFWWGKGFSIHLVLGGSYKLRYEQQILSNIRKSDSGDWYISVPEDPWQHHFEPDNYQLIHSPGTELSPGLLAAGNYLKLAKKHPFKDWEKADVFFTTSFHQLLLLLY